MCQRLKNVEEKCLIRTCHHFFHLYVFGFFSKYIMEYQCYQLRTKLYPISFFQG
jgi:hypothetical protein